MWKGMRGAFVLGIGCLGLLSGNLLSAAEVRSQKFTVPFTFKVYNKVMPAGEYRVEQSAGTEITNIVNVRTGQRVYFMRPTPLRVAGKARLLFEEKETVYSL